ncbi:hypothetical protein GUITHDRAFT_103334 [Guillardia theta CCMP2712]|uniref:Uncharacterized protein n=1 Tax=Guillardia theta (strain CCMP2712) TaxID=905079 RepID=L1JRM5_GUITC|nr:hypothetical protein GUITHDRAFT_103334 [Guillardia theta CCMP2712]EKX50743.1 hypothetical protein GUITHDRAFT_103334 [Guillardia theta CCMP2712]|eukprot:XP_005837723.1 hypothetical protein GUITHDRAFT_103334 [Guillardia theta CCMP2712]
MAQFPTKMAEIYGRIMGDVMEESRNKFIGQGMDTNVLSELQRLWTEKLNAYGTHVRTDLAGGSMLGGYVAACPPLMQHDAQGYPLDMRRDTGFPQTDGADTSLQIFSESAEDESSEEGGAKTGKSSSATRDLKACTIVIEQTDGAGSSPIKRRRVGEDGESDGDDDEEEEGDEGANEEEELGSEDDDDDEEDDVANSTHNLILCQYEKVSRTKNKWKAQLKFGVMTLAINDGGRDFVFKKGNSDMNFSS